jgi:hypothetical protein
MSQVANPKLWKSIKNKWHRGSKGGKAGQWNARKAQLAVQEYKRRGGKYKTKRPAPNNSLVKWTKEDWGYIDGKKGNRYLPKNVRDHLTSAEKRATNARKKAATRRGQQYAPWSKSVNTKFKKYTGRKPRRKTTKRSSVQMKKRSSRRKPAKRSSRRKPRRKTGGAQRKPAKRGPRPTRLKNGTIKFKDHPEFTPNLTPRDIFKLGSFGGTYWRPIKSGVTKKKHRNVHKEFPNSWWNGIPKSHLTSPNCKKEINKYGVNSGTSLRYWEKKKWIKAQDPYGWVQWYCRFYQGRRSPDDARQIKRWQAFAGPKGRFKLRLVNMIKKKRTTWNDYSVSPVIRQGLQHWAYQLKSSDLK